MCTSNSFVYHQYCVQLVVISMRPIHQLHDGQRKRERKAKYNCFTFFNNRNPSQLIRWYRHLSTSTKIILVWRMPIAHAIHIQIEIVSFSKFQFRMQKEQSFDFVLTSQPAKSLHTISQIDSDFVDKRKESESFFLPQRITTTSTIIPTRSFPCPDRRSCDGRCGSGNWQFSSLCVESVETMKRVFARMLFVVYPFNCVYRARWMCSRSYLPLCVVLYSYVCECVNTRTTCTHNTLADSHHCSCGRRWSHFISFRFSIFLVLRYCLPLENTSVFVVFRKIFRSFVRFGWKRSHRPAAFLIVIDMHV